MLIINFLSPGIGDHYNVKEIIFILLAENLIVKFPRKSQ